jgi:hypothetical protein
VTTSSRAPEDSSAGTLDGQPPFEAPRRVVRVLATVAVLALVGSFVAAQVDFLRRHEPGILPARYWYPQLRNIWAPGLTLALVCAAAAFALHRWWRRK